MNGYAYANANPVNGAVSELNFMNGYAYANANPVNGAVGEPVFSNGYAYANANPVNLVDPTGMYGERPEDFVGICKQEINNPNGCVAAPFGNSGSVEPTYKPAGFVRLTYFCDGNASTRQTWVDERVADVRTALADIDNRFSILGISHRAWDIFRDLEFRIVPAAEVKYGLTISERLVVWSETAINQGGEIPSPQGTLTPSVAEYFQWLVVHELGHVLQNRTKDLQNDSMYRTADYNRLDLPAIGPYGRQAAQNGNAVEERVADHFLNWVYDTQNVN